MNCDKIHKAIMKLLEVYNIDVAKYHSTDFIMDHIKVKGFMHAENVVALCKAAEAAPNWSTYCLVVKIIWKKQAEEEVEYTKL